MFEESFRHSGYEVRALSELGPQFEDVHYTHAIESFFREGGGAPPVWARANGVDSVVLGITFMEELLGVFVRTDDPARSVADLAGRRLGLPVWPRLVFNFWRFAALKGLHSALAVHGLRDEDVEFVDGHFSAVVRYLRTLIRAARWIEANRAEARRLIAQECSVGRDEIDACLEAGYFGKFLPRLSGELVETLAVMKTFLYERRFIARDFALEGWIDPRPLAEAYRLEGLDRVVPGGAVANQKNTKDRTTTFLRQGASSGAVGSKQAVWKDQRETEPSVTES